MTQTNADRGRWSTIGAVLISAAALLFAAPAAADQADDLFIAGLQKGGIAVPDRSNMIAMGHTVCGELAKSKPPTAVVMSLVESTEMSTKEAGYFVGVSVAAYCPQYRSAMGPSGHPPGA
jgi:hypothetical protein